jgi:hypothetical protein
MKCRKCGEDFIAFFSEVCPFCGTDNTITWGDIFDTLTGSMEQNKGVDRKGKVDPDDWEYHDNCSDEEYEDDEDYDDSDN